LFLGVARHYLTQVRGSLLSKREILSVLCSYVRTITFVEAGTKVYLRDVMDHIELMIQRLDVRTRAFLVVK
jgi:Mg2+ and Co2+ transporter CorA